MKRQPSHQTQRVFQAFLDAPSEEIHGYEIAKAAGLAGGVVYPILRRLDEDGLLESRWEQLRPAEGGRRRRYYRLTGEGRRAALEATRDQAPALRLMSPGWAAA